MLVRKHPHDFAAPPLTTSLWRLLLLLVAILVSPTTLAQQATDMALYGSPNCYIDGLDEQVICGSILRAENPDVPEGKRITVHYVILPAIKRTHPSEAMLAIAGGPGQSAIDNAAGFNRMLSKVRQQRDILLIDQRGTGRSNRLNCPNDIQDALAINENRLDNEQETRQCLSALTPDNDVRQYGSVIALNDFEAVRQYLGYQKLHLYGISYGSRMAQLYMRHYADHLATVTLDGVVPMQQSVIAIGSAIERAFQLLIDDCNNDSLCQHQFPQLSTDLTMVQTRLNQQAEVSQVHDPLTGESTTLTMTQQKFMGSIRMALYSPHMRALLPYAIHQAALGNYQAILGLYAMTIDSTGIALGMHQSVVCGEDWPRLTPQLRAQTSQTYFGKEMLAGFDKSCALWNMPAATPRFSHAVVSDIPTLVLSGELDPATPPSWGELAIEKFTNAKHLVAPYATHGVAYQSCANKLLAELVNSGDVQSIDAKCLDKDVSRNFYLNASSVETIPTDSDSHAATTSEQ